MTTFNIQAGRDFFNSLPAAKKARKVRLTAEQSAALAAYNECLRQEDRYFGSVFANQAGSDAIEAKTKIAYDRCKSLGMTHEHGL
jgi:hypothetical protein